MDGGGVSKCGVVKALCAAGASVTKKSENFRMTALHWASVCGHLDVVEELLAAGSSTTTKDQMKRNAAGEAEARIKSLEENLDHFGKEYKADDKEERIAEYKKIVAACEAVTASA